MIVAIPAIFIMALVLVGLIMVSITLARSSGGRIFLGVLLGLGILVLFLGAFTTTVSRQASPPRFIAHSTPTPSAQQSYRVSVGPNGETTIAQGDSSSAQSGTAIATATEGASEHISGGMTVPNQSTQFTTPAMPQNAQMPRTSAFAVPTRVAENGPQLQLSWIMLLAILIVPIILYCLFVAFSANRQASIFLVLFCLVPLGGFLIYFLVQHDQHEPSGVAVVQPQLPQVSTSSTPSVIWSDETDGLFLAETYPSVDDTARGIALAATKLAGNVLPAGQQPVTIQILSEEDSPIIDGIASDVASILKKEFTKSDVKQQNESAELNTGSEAEPTLIVRLHVVSSGSHSPAPWSETEQEDRFNINLSVESTGGEKHARIACIEKPWVDGYAEFVAQNPQRLVVRSRGEQFSASETEAHRDALTQAEDTLLKLLKVESERQRYGNVPYRQLRNTLRSKLNAGRFTVDRFPQKLSHDQGDVWREALLLSLNPEDLAEMVSEAHTASVSQKQERASRGAVLATLCFLVFALVISLNSLTQGYFKNWFVWGALGLGCVVLMMA